jgi:hypothetical protein
MPTLPAEITRFRRITRALARQLAATAPEHELLRFAEKLGDGSPLHGELLEEFMDRFGHDVSPQTMFNVWGAYLKRLQTAIVTIRAGTVPALPALPAPDRLTTKKAPPPRLRLVHDADTDPERPAP